MAGNRSGRERQKVALTWKANCIHDLSGKQTPLEITADFAYVRFHGPEECQYSGSYSSQRLKKWAERINGWRKELLTVYAYFNNDIGGCAVRNARDLMQLVT
ncbi:MAG: DUF72 domain-containing protein [Pyrinomonadaceae bacterium]